MGETRQPVRNRFQPSGFSHPHLCQGKVQFSAAKLRQGPWLFPGAVMGKGVCGLLRFLSQICSPYLTSLGFCPTRVSPLAELWSPPSASVSPGADSTGGVQYATSDTNEHAFSVPSGEGLVGSGVGDLGGSYGKLKPAWAWDGNYGGPVPAPIS